MMYRSGYSTKDARQSHILALKMTHKNFRNLLGEAVVCHGATLTKEERERPVRVQWDPERGPGLELLKHRSIQIGIGEKLSRKWAEEWIESIEDVTERALELKNLKEELDEKGEMMLEEELLRERGLLPLEREYEVSEHLRKILQMDETS
jgi:hypothetical protein